MWLKYVGPRYGGGVVEDYEHEKKYWGPENNWMCEVPDRLAGMVIQAKGTDMFLPCLPPGTQVSQGTTDEQKQKEEELLTREIEIEDREKAVAVKEKDLDTREKELKKKGKGKR